MKPFSFLLVILLGATSADASVRMCSLFGDHMVLQQEMKVPVWGTALAGEKVTVTAGDHAGSAVADADGKWRVDLKPFPNGAAPITLTVKSDANTLTFQDVLVGEVWIASGQSNMEVPVNWMADAAQVSAGSTDTQLRVFYVEHNPWQATSLVPRDDVTGHWAVCTPDVCNNFSAVGYFFARDLREHLKRPVGVIGSYVGGTPASSWISLSGLMKAPPFTTYVDKYYEAKQSAMHQPMDLANGIDALNRWGDAYQASLAKAISDCKQSMISAEAGNNPQPAVAQVAPGPMPQLPPNPAGSRYTPCVLFNAEIAPLMPYAMRGVIWYQGEDNAVALDHAHEYGTLFPRLIDDWRAKWGEGEFPFLFVQLASFTRDDIGGAGGINWAIGRESQSKALALPRTGMVTAVDIGGGADVHPRDKVDVGKRLALQARHVAYGEKDLVYTGPTFEKMAVEGGSIRVTFKDTGSGLIIGKAPWVSPGIEPTPDTSLVGFTISGADKKFVAADAKIDGNSVILSSPKVPAPVAARYYWDNLTQANLYNKEGLPAFPFRTDTWDDVPSPANPPVMH